MTGEFLNQRGLIPGPHESESQFLRRVECCPSSSCLTTVAALYRVREIFHCRPDWVEVSVHSKGLHFWEGAATWIEEDPGGVRRCHIVVKNSFLSRLYPKEEIIAHEMVHAIRIMFDESRFEEILAYRTSRNAFRRYWGPVCGGSKETAVFLTSLIVWWCSWMAEIFLDIEAGSRFFVFLPCMVLAWGIIRLIRSQRLFTTALELLEKAVGKPGKAVAVALGLTDAEIALFARMSSEEIRAFAGRQKEQSIRWKQLYRAYF